MEKAIMVFSKNVGDGDKTEISIMWDCRDTKKYEKYLSFPPMIGRLKKRAFFEIKIKIWQRLQTWKGKLLLQAEK